MCLTIKDYHDAGFDAYDNDSSAREDRDAACVDAFWLRAREEIGDALVA